MGSEVVALISPRHRAEHTRSPLVAQRQRRSFTTSTAVVEGMGEGPRRKDAACHAATMIVPQGQNAEPRQRTARARGSGQIEPKLAEAIQRVARRSISSLAAAGRKTATPTLFLCAPRGQNRKSETAAPPCFSLVTDRATFERLWGRDQGVRSGIPTFCRTIYTDLVFRMCASC